MHGERRSARRRAECSASRELLDDPSLRSSRGGGWPATTHRKRPESRSSSITIAVTKRPRPNCAASESSIADTVRGSGSGGGGRCGTRPRQPRPEARLRGHGPWHRRSRRAHALAERVVEDVATDLVRRLDEAADDHALAADRERRHQRPLHLGGERHGPQPSGLRQAVAVRRLTQQDLRRSPANRSARSRVRSSSSLNVMPSAPRRSTPSSSGSHRRWPPGTGIS